MIPAEPSRSPLRWLVSLIVIFAFGAAVLANLWSVHEHAAGVPSLRSGEPGFEVAALADPTGRLTFEQVERRTADFKPMAQLQAAPPWVWYRYVIRNGSARDWHAIMALSSDYILSAVQYQRLADGAVTAERSGGTVRWYDRPIRAGKVAFGVEVPARGQAVGYVLVHDPIKQPDGFFLWSDSRVFSRLAELFKLEFIGYYSLWFGLFVYNGILYAILRRRDYLYYLGYMLALAVTLAMGSDISSLVIAWPLWPLRGILSFFAVNVTVFMLLRFTQVFLDIPNRMPRIGRALRWAGICLMGIVLAAPAMLNRDTAPIFSAIDIVSDIAVLVALGVLGVACWLRRVPQAGIYVVAFLPLIAGFVYVLQNTHGLPDGHTGSMPPLTGSALELVFLALALAWRNRAITDERDRLRNEYTAHLETEVTQRTQELRVTNESLAKANRDKDRVFSILGHDLRGPAQQLSGLSRLMADAPEVMPAKEAALLAVEIEEACMTQLELLDNLILWGRTQADGSGDQPVQVGSARDLAIAAVAALAQAARRKQIALIIHPGDDVSVRGNATAAQAILRNLIGNALKFTPLGGGIAVTVSADRSQVRFEVADTGVGIAPERLKDVLAGPVRSTTGTRQEKGSGIGLAICRDLARANGGDLLLASELGKGTKATLVLPGG